MNYIVLILAALATFRVSRMVAEEDGPFDVFKKVRDKLQHSGNWVSRGVRCQLCVGFWVSLLLSLYLVVVGLMELSYLPVAWLGIAGLAVKLKDFWSK